jgi:hypothetical protein
MEIILTDTIMRHFILILALAFVASTLAQPPGYFPPPSSVNFHDDTLAIYPPDSLPGDPAVLIGYNVYVDSLFYDYFQVASQYDTADYIFDITTLMPGNREFCAKAVYNSWISEPTCDTGIITYGYELPFFEDWSSGDFETNHWTVSSDHWTVDTANGNPSPEARFSGTPGLQDYSEVLESFAFRSENFEVGRLTLNFDLKLQSINSTSNEKFYLQVWKSTTSSWLDVYSATNENGSFDWTNCWINLTYIGHQNIILRFIATGENSEDISSWSIDNINFKRSCFYSTDLTLEENLDYNELSWTPPTACCGAWYHWDDGENKFAIGTGEPGEYDIAARWDPYQLIAWDGMVISEVKVYPTEQSANYSLRIWQDFNASNLICDQIIDNPVIGQWNKIALTDTIYLDATKELWVGFHVNTQTGYPFGSDDGPALDGLGNMIKIQGEWNILSYIYPELDYNWNIQVHLGSAELPNVYCNIYRQTNDGDFEYYDFVEDVTYRDNDIVLSDYYCYQVTTVWEKDGDTCESIPTNEACEVLMLQTDENSKQGKVSLFPNPASNFIRIKSDEKMININLYNILGDKLINIHPDQADLKMPVSNLQNGIFFIEIETQSRTVTRKIIINH